MSYIIMGRDECNEHFRPDFPEFNTKEEAYAKLSEARYRYQEARAIWVELLKDKDYYLQQREYHDDYWD